MAAPAGAGIAEQAPSEQFGQFREAAARAAGRCGGWSERAIAIAGRPFCLRFAGEHLRAALSESFAHLELRGGVPEHASVVEVFESQSSGVDRPQLAWAELPDSEGEPIVRLRSGDFQGVADSGSTIVAMADLPQQAAVMHVPDLEEVDPADLGARLRPPLMLLLGGLGPLPLHAAAVGVGDCGALIAGMSGAGKSTLAVACALRGMTICGDDYVVLAGSADAHRAHALNSTVRVSAQSAELLGLGPRVAAAANRARDCKAQLDLEEIAPGTLRTALGLRLLAVPRRDRGGPPRALSAAAAMRALAPSTVLQSPGRRPQAMSTLAGLVRRLPAYEVPGADGPAVAAEGLRALLTSLD